MTYALGGLAGLVIRDVLAWLDRRDCYWLYVITNCRANPQLQEPVKDPARFEWTEVAKVAQHYLSVDAVTKPMQVREELSPYGASQTKETRQ